jgi:preprotein translocase subunit SecE
MANPDDTDDKKRDVEIRGAEGSSGEATTAERSEAGEAVDAEVVGDIDRAVAQASEQNEAEEAPTATTFGSERYVHAAFFLAGILAAYVASKTIGMAWSSISGLPAAVRAVPALVSYTEEQRDGISLAMGAGVGTLAVVQAYRKENVRIWANEVAAELSKVTWPTREAVLNGTLVVVVASAIATFYVAILDRLWGFLTTLVYGA